MLVPALVALAALAAAQPATDAADAVAELFALADRSPPDAAQAVAALARRAADAAAADRPALSAALLDVAQRLPVPETADPQVYGFIGDLRNRAGDRAAAIRALEIAVDVDPFLPKARQMLGELRFRSEDYAGAAKDLQRAADMGAEPVERCYRLVALALVREGQPAAALSAATDGQVQDLAVWEELASAFTAAGDLPGEEAALEAMIRVVAADRLPAAAYNRLGRVLASQGVAQRARIDRVSKTVPQGTYVAFFDGVGSGFYALKEFAAARDYLQLVVSLTSHGHARCVQLLQLSLLEIDTPAAWDEFADLVSVLARKGQMESGMASRWYRRMGVLHRRAGNDDRALELFARAQASDPTDFWWLSETAALLVRQKRFAAGIALLQQLRLAPLAEYWNDVLVDRLRPDRLSTVPLGDQVALAATAPAPVPVEVPGGGAVGDVAAARSVNGVIYFLGIFDDDEVASLCASLHLLDTNFNRRFRYPIVVFYEVLSAEHEARLRSCTDSAIEFARVEFEIPAHLDAASVPESVDSFSIGYRHMCRFMSYSVYDHPALAPYEYAWRLDTDSFIIGPVNEDVFAQLVARGCTYGFVQIDREPPGVVDGLWELTQRFVAEHGVDPQMLHRFIDRATGAWNRAYFYTNFELSRLDFWRGPYRAYFDAIDRDGGIYHKRWGDGPIHLLGVALFLPEAEVCRFADVPYWHGIFVQ